MRCARVDELLPPSPPGKTGWPWTEQSPQLPEALPDGSPWPRVSIVTPSYNQGQFIEETIRSVLLQGYPNLEYIIMDGGSTDDSVAIIRKYEPWLASWVSEPDDGQADAINQGWSRATGDFLGWINSDDVLTLGSVALIVRYFHHHRDVGFVFGDLERIDAQSQHLSFQGYKEFDLVDIVRTAGWISQPGNLFRLSVFQQVGFLDCSLHFAMDLDYWLRAGLVCKFGYLRHTVARFRRHRDAKTCSQGWIAGKDRLSIYRKLFNRTDLPVELLRVRQEAWANAHLYAVGTWLGSSRFQQACRELLRGCWAYPPVVFSRRFYHCLRDFAKVSVGKARRWSRTAKAGVQKH